MSKLFLNSKEYTLPLIITNIGKTSYEIYQSLTSDNHEYVVQSKVDEEVFNEFILYLTEDKTPEIHIDNIFGLQQLAIEFGTKDIIDAIKRKADKWREIETQLENQSAISNPKEQELEAKIHVLAQNMQLLHQDLEAFKAEIRNQNTSNQAEQSERERNQENQINMKFSEIQDALTQKIETTKNEIEEEIYNIKQKIENIENQILEQINQTNEHSTIINRLENQINSLQNELINNKTQMNQTEENINSTIEAIKLSIDEIKKSYVTKDVLIFK